MEKNWVIFDRIPTEEEAEITLDRYLEKNKRFRDLLKIGKTSMESITDAEVGVRYCSTDKYEALALGNIICEVADEQIALQIERLFQRIAIKREILIPNSDNGEGVLSNGRFSYIIYATKLKSELFNCPADRCVFVATFEGVNSHKLTHESITTAIECNKLLNTLGLMELKIDTKPQPWTLDEKVGSTCRHCERVFSTRHDMLDHEKHSCRKNKNRRDLVKCPDCPAFIIKSGLKRHRRKHLKKPPMFICDICGGEFKWEGRCRHMRVHMGKFHEKCPECGKTFSKGHIKTHIAGHKGLKRFCLACKEDIPVLNFGNHVKKHKKQGIKGPFAHPIAK